VAVDIAGYSRRGEPIPLLRIGAGRFPVLLVACPHPNEPVGAMTVVTLAERLAQDGALRTRYDVTWLLLPCVDPDGTRLNEGWFRGPFTIEQYVRHFYRPPFPEQVEWTFPLQYRTLRFDDPLPETQCLMRLIEAERPSFIYSLHNAGFGGVYFYLSRGLPGLAPALHRVVETSGLPLSVGEPEVPYAPRFAPAVFGIPRKAAAYDFYARQGAPDPATFLTGGAGSLEYAERFGLRLGLVCEVPYFYDARVADATPAEIPRRQSFLSALEVSEAVCQFLAPCLEALRPYGLRSPFFSALEHTLRTTPQRLAAERLAAERDPAYSRLASRAEVFDSEVTTRFYAALSIGMFLRLLDEARERIPQDLFRRCAQQGENLLQLWLGKIQTATAYSVIPIRTLVAVQVASGLVCLEGLLDVETG